ncbi:hypothetical protein [Poseidonibacter antarcticus]|uniref:hypothetical protein n=1 Tax=Poseidonibacter antarcticus TaxID=2478538 RepID=UPI000EF4F243|nr:hypothetical protein [Poseidonibacter antarcticus]
MDLVTSILGFDLMSFFGNIFMVLMLILIIGIILGRQVFSIKGLAIVSVITIFILGGGTIYRYINTFKGPGISFYKINNDIKENIYDVPDEADTKVIDLADYGVNDEANALKLIEIKKGTLIHLYDSPDGSQEDDWAEIYVKKDIKEMTIDSFEQNKNNDEIDIYYSKNNGLNGKVSRVVIQHNATPSSRISFHEGNGLKENKVCEFAILDNSFINFKNDDKYGCDNDEVRSVLLRHIPPNTRIRLFDDPNGSLKDDWLDIFTLKTIDILEIETLELQKDINNDKYIIQYHKKNGLDGKVSAVEITQKSNLEPLAVFYDDMEGKGNIVKVINLSKTFDEKLDGKGENDEAKSVILYNIPAGKRLSVYDNPHGDLNDDWAEIYVKKDIKEMTINSFEQNKNYTNYEIHFYPKNNLNGKISYLKVADAETFSSFIELMEVNKNKENIICRLSTSPKRKVNLKKESHCKNDEANSIQLYYVPKNTYISVYDDPNCNGEKDDWTEIYVKKDTKSLQINNFEQNISNKSNYSVKYHKDNGLNGKVSCIKFGK